MLGGSAESSGAGAAGIGKSLPMRNSTASNEVRMVFQLLSKNSSVQVAVPQVRCVRCMVTRKTPHFYTVRCGGVFPEVSRTQEITLSSHRTMTRVLRSLKTYHKEFFQSESFSRIRTRHRYSSIKTIRKPKLDYERREKNKEVLWWFSLTMVIIV